MNTLNVNWSTLGAGALVAFAIWSQEVNNRKDQACTHLWNKMDVSMAVSVVRGSTTAGKAVEDLERVFGVTLEQCRNR